MIIMLVLTMVMYDDDHYQWDDSADHGAFMMKNSILNCLPHKIPTEVMCYPPVFHSRATNV